MTIHGQTLGVFKRENNKKSCNGEKTKLHKIEIVVFLKLAYVVLWRVFHHELRHYDVKLT